MVHAVALSQHVVTAIRIQVFVDVGQQVIGEAAHDVAHRLAPEVHLGMVHLEHQQVIVLEHQVGLVLSEFDDRIGHDVHDGLQQALVEETESHIGAHGADDAAEAFGVLHVVDHHLAVNE